MTNSRQSQIKDLNVLKDTPPWKWPKKTGNMILKILRDPGADPSERLTAAAMAGDFSVINDKLAGTLVTILQNPDEPEHFRLKAALSLGPVLEYSHTFGPGSDASTISRKMIEKIKESLRCLYEYTHVPAKIRRRILEVSVRAPQDWHTEVVRTAYLSDDVDYQLTAVFCMGFIPGFENEIMEAMESDNPAIRHEAIKASRSWQVDTDWLDMDSPLTSGEDDYFLLRSAIRAANDIGSVETGDSGDLPGYTNNREFLDKFQDVLTMDNLPWDDEFIEIDEDDLF